MSLQRHFAYQRMQSLYSIDVLMEKTRELAAHYRVSTGQVLPVSGELARFDVQRLFHCLEPTNSEKGIDLMGQGPWQDQKIQVKSRVIFDFTKSGHRLGQINEEGSWDLIVLVLYDEHYQPFEIYAATREALIDALQMQNPKKRPLSIAKFKALGSLVWSSTCGLESEGWNS